jgi:hypothetical protein
MKLKLKFETEDSGLLILEQEPQNRVLMIGNRHATYNLPYVLYVIRYLKAGGRFQYDGIHGHGLQVFFTNKPLETLEDTVYFPPTDSARFGLICTDHRYDSKSYPTLSKLTKTVINLWLNTQHQMQSSIYWKENKGIDIDWSGTYPQILAITKRVQRLYGITFPVNLLKSASTLVKAAGYGRVAKPIWDQINLNTKLDNIDLPSLDFLDF